MKMSNANFVLRLIKHKKHSFQSSLNHSTRTHIPENINAEQSHWNKHYTKLNNDHYLESNRLTPKGLKAEITSKATAQIDERVGKLRQNSVYAVEFVISASNEHLATMTRKEQEDYFKQGIDYIQARFGDDNFLSAHIHYDERTPHAHVFFSSVAFDEKKNKYKTHFKAFIDGPKALSDFQDNFHKDVAQHYGMAENKKKSRVSHTKLTQFYNLVDKHKSELNNLDYEQLDNEIKTTFVNEAKTANKTILDRTLKVVSNICEKPLYSLNIDDFDMFLNALTKVNVQKDIKASIRKQRKIVEERKKAQELTEKYELEQARHELQLIQMHRDWFKHKNALIEMLKTEAKPTNEIQQSFVDRLDALQAELDWQSSRKLITSRDKNYLRAYLATPLENLSAEEQRWRYAETYHLGQAQTPTIRQYLINNPNVAFEQVLSPETSHPKDFITQLIYWVKAFIQAMKIPTKSELQQLNRNEQNTATNVFTMI